MELRPVQIVRAKIPNLNAAISATPVDHLSLVRILRRSDRNFGSAGAFRLHQGMVGQLLLHTDLFGVHVPLANCAILRTSQEKVVLLRVPLAVVNAGHVALGVGHIEQVHVTANCCLLSNAL